MFCAVLLALSGTLGVVAPAPLPGVVWQSSNSSVLGAEELLAFKGPVPWVAGDFDSPLTVALDFGTLFQTIHGFGTAFTEAAGLSWLALTPANQQRLLKLYFAPPPLGLGYTTGRIPLGSPDFATSDYALANCWNDTALACFDYNLTRDSANGVVAMLRGACATAPSPPNFFFAPWSPPAWMKLPTAAHNYSMDGTARPVGLNPYFNRTFAKYLSAFATALKAKGVPLWGFSIQNEPTAVAPWPQCDYTPQYALELIRDHVMPVMSADHPELNLMIFDHNNDVVLEWVTTLLTDATVADYAWGTAVHGYSAQANQRNLNASHYVAPRSHILHTETCNCLGGPAGNRPVLRGASPLWWGFGEHYAYEIMGFLQNWAEGFTDWNALLNAEGGPSHQRGFGCDAPLFSDGKGDFVQQASYFVTAHFSQFLPPGTQVVGVMGAVGAAPAFPPSGSFYQQTVGTGGPLGNLGLVAGVQPNGTVSLVVFNGGGSAVNFKLRVPGDGGPFFANLTIPAHALQTLSW